uniref:N-acetyltransferase n=1 Tax=Rhizophora mucronata TaxID=61149 RepID=A0A2P2J4L4_RHIMU
MAGALSFSLTFSFDQRPIQASPLFVASPCNNPKHPVFFFNKRRRFRFISSSSSQSSSTGAPSAYSYLDDSFKPRRFLSNEELEKLKILQDFSYQGELRNGSMWVRVMRPEEVEKTVTLLAESFAESMYLTAAGYVALLMFLVKQYLTERRAVMPHAVTLVGFYRGKEEEEEEELAGTVEVCFDKMGANASPSTPTPPKNSPYICNMAVKQSLRRYVLVNRCHC